MSSNSKLDEKEIRSPYLYMIISSLGMLLLLFGVIEALSRLNRIDATTFLLPFFGFMILVHYIYHLEKKAGISNKWIWIRSVVLIATVVGVTALVY